MFAVELLWRWQSLGKTPFFIRCDQMVSQLFGDGGEELKSQTYDAVMNASVLLIDDLGWGAIGRGIERVNEVVAVREQDHRRTIWTTNLKPSELTKRMSPMMARFEEGLILPLGEGDVWSQRKARS